MICSHLLMHFVMLEVFSDPDAPVEALMEALVLADSLALVDAPWKHWYLRIHWRWLKRPDADVLADSGCTC